MPPAAPPIASFATPGPGAAELERGRRVYLTDCARCHAPIRITDHGVAEWRAILPDMIGEAYLDDADARAVTRYVMAARRAASDPK